MNNDQMRRDFESWLIKDQTAKMVARFGGLPDGRYQTIITLTWLPRDGDQYKAVHAQELWDAWCASREAVVIELPDHCCYDLPGEAYPAIQDCREAIEAAGLKVTP